MPCNVHYIDSIHVLLHVYLNMSLFEANVNGIIFLIFLSKGSLLVHSNVIHSGRLILYPPTLLKYLVLGFSLLICSFVW